MPAFKTTRPASSFLATWLLVTIAIAAGRGVVVADTGGVLKIKPDKHDFGQVVATKDSAPLTITVTNKSESAPVTFASILAAETFSIQSDKCSGAPLAPGRSCKVEIVFHPLVDGKVSDLNARKFTDSAQNSPQQVELDGQGILGGFL